MSSVTRRYPVGAEPQPEGGVHFRVWAPDAGSLSLVLERDGQQRDVPLARQEHGYYAVLAADADAGTRYWYRVDGGLLPDPASRWQPDGPFAASEVVDPKRFAWTVPESPGLSIRGQVVYEMHIGTFTPEGTWRSAISKLPLLARTGVTVLEIMPVAEFPGRFGWGYDGVFPFAPTRLYGAPDDFRAFVDAAHAQGLGVILDVVYNHLGPDGCVFARYASDYFAPDSNEWGDALNFDGPNAGPVREFFSSNAAHWIDEYRLDGLRLDATQSLQDRSTDHILALIARTARSAARGRRILLIAENERQESRLARPQGEGGYGLDALCNDDFHHSAAVALTGRREAFFSDHRGAPQEFISAAKRGYLFQGQRYAWQQQKRGSRTDGLDPATFVNFIENHDQLANSADGSRLHTRTSPGRYRAMTAMLLLMPGTPMLFQGQEFAASAPFLYFADHHAELAAAVQKGRAEFMSQFPSLAAAAMRGRLPVPHDPRTFQRSVLDWDEYERHATDRQLHEDLLALRRRDAGFSVQRAGAVDGAVLAPEALVLRYLADRPGDERLLCVNLGSDLEAASFPEPLVAPPDGRTWRVRWSSEDPRYGGTGTPEVVGERGWLLPGHAAVVFEPE